MKCTHISCRQIEQQLGIKRSTTNKIIKQHKFHPYHILLVQELSNEDCVNRRNFCLWALEKNQQQPYFFDYVLMTDKATFHKNGFVNRHNFHYYSNENPRYLRALDHQHRWSLNGTKVFGPYFFNEAVNGQNFLNFLRTDLENAFEDLPLQTVRRMWLQLDGAPPHFSRPGVFKFTFSKQMDW